MKNKHKLKYLAALLSCLFMGTALADTVPEVEPNDSATAPQQLVSSVNTSVNAYLGNNSTGDDLDYYSFYANAGDVLTINIDHGYGMGTSVDTTISVFDPSNGYTILRTSGDLDSTQTLDAGSVSPYDPRIDNFVAPASGYYVVGVTNWPREFTDGGGLVNPYASSAQGDYILVISGGTPTAAAAPAAVVAKEIAIMIKPGEHYMSRINPSSRGKIPVAILGGPDFNVSSIDKSSLTFGSTGDEQSLIKCISELKDVNDDGRLDMLCLFSNQASGFQLTDVEATLRGRTMDEKPFTGTGAMKVIPYHREKHHHHNHD